MPPKAPNLKFKPKLVSKAKQPAPGEAGEWEDLSLLQLERIHRQGDPALAADGSAQQLSSASPASSTPNVGSPTTAAPGPGAVGGQQPGAPAAPGGRRAAGQPRPQQSAHASLQEASSRYVDLSAYPEHADRLPVNTLHTQLTGHASASYGHTAVYQPVALDTISGQSGAGDNAAGSSDRASSLAQLDGTAFLREGGEELKRACATNKEFYERSLDGGHAQHSEFDMDAGTLVWMQMPRFHGSPAPLVLKDMPPGKIGELKVFKSGRMVLDIGGVYYDVWAEDQPSDGGSCTTVAVTQPSPYPMDPAYTASCYQVGALEKKLVCTPTIQE